MLNVSDNVDLWDFKSHGERVKIGCGLCKDPMFALAFGPLGVEYYIIVSLLVLFDSFAQHNLFYPIPSARCYGTSMGMYCFCV